MSNEMLTEFLKERRLDLGLSLRDVARMVGVNASTINRWESGDIENMKRDKIRAYAKALQISPSVIMGWEAPEVGIIVQMSNYEEDLFRKYRSLDQHQRQLVDDLIYTLYNSNNKK